MKRCTFLLLGFGFLTLAAIGVVLPVMPTAPFLIVAAYFFARSDRRVHAWLLNLPWAGPMIRDWEHHRSIPRRVRWMAITMVLITSSISYFILGEHATYLRYVLITFASVGIVVILRIPTR